MAGVQVWTSQRVRPAQVCGPPQVAAVQVAAPAWVQRRLGQQSTAEIVPPQPSWGTVVTGKVMGPVQRQCV
ncbi:MAG TPA: hypothetical protein VJA16_07655 [Thermoanaerobaculia bacterium]